MRVRGSIALVLVMALGAGCSNSPGRPMRPWFAASLPSDPTKAMAVLADQVGTQPRSFTMGTYGMPGAVYGDVASLEHWQISTDTFSLRRIGPDLYFTLRGHVLDQLPPGFYARTVGAKWVHGPLPAYSESEDIYQHDYPYTHVHEAARGTAMTWAGDEGISGVMPPGIAGISSASTPASEFTASVGNAGNLDGLTIITAGESKSFSIDFRPYDGPAVTAPPPSEVAKVSDQDYLMLRSMLAD